VCGEGGEGVWGGAFWKYHNHVKESLPAHDDEGREFGIISHNNNMPQGAKLVLQWAGKKGKKKKKKKPKNLYSLVSTCEDRLKQRY
jgi:hypothetical protein